MAPIITPFKIAIPDSSLETLQTKLKASVFPDDSELYNNWEFGAPQRDIQRLAEYWADGFDWRKQEAKLNELPQFKTTVSVDGFGELGIHFVHQRSEREGSIPLLFCHGCTYFLSSPSRILKETVRLTRSRARKLHRSP